MKCPFCSADDTKVVDSRLSKEGEQVRRRRACEACGRRFTTYERLELTLPWVVKKDGRREAFDRGKILDGLRHACQKRPVGIDALETIVDGLERKLQDRGDKEVTSASIGEELLRALHTLDKVAYVRFASVYREFQDIDQFMEELKRLLQDRERTEPSVSALE